HVALEPAGAGDRVDHQVDALVEALHVEVDLQAVAGADHHLAGHHRSGAARPGPLGLELLDDRRKGACIPGQGVEHLEIEMLMGGTESGEHDRSLGPPAAAPKGPARPLGKHVHNGCVMTQNSTSEPPFTDIASDRSRRLSESGIAAGPRGGSTPDGSAAAASASPLAAPDGASALPPGHPAARLVAEGGVADA